MKQLKPKAFNYTKEELISICEKALVDQTKWKNRDSASAQKQVGEASVLLRAGCKFRVLTEGDLQTDESTIWLEIDVEDFQYFEDGIIETQTFYLPTKERLNLLNGNDWYI